jgi:hypothetical protein
MRTPERALCSFLEMLKSRVKGSGPVHACLQPEAAARNAPKARDRHKLQID